MACRGNAAIDVTIVLFITLRRPIVTLATEKYNGVRLPNYTTQYGEQTLKSPLFIEKCRTWVSEYPQRSILLPKAIFLHRQTTK